MPDSGKNPLSANKHAAAAVGAAAAACGCEAVAEAAGDATDAVVLELHRHFRAKNP